MNTWFCASYSRWREDFIIGDPRRRGAAVVFTKSCDGVTRYRGLMVGVYGDDYKRVATIPSWVRPLLLSALLGAHETKAP